MYIDEKEKHKIIERMRELKDESLEVDDVADIIYTGEFYILQTINDDGEDLEFAWEIYDDVKYYDTFIMFADVINFLNQRS